MARQASPPSLLTVGSVPQHIRRLAVPMVIGVFAMISVNLVDTYFVGLLGTDQLAAMSFTFPVVGLIINLCMGLAIGVTATVARLIGAEDNERAEVISGHALSIALILSVSLGILGFVAQDYIFSLMGAPDKLLSYLRDYMRWWFIGLPFLVMVIIANGILRARGDSKRPMRLMLLAAGCNVVLDPLLIFGLAGAPKLGLEGASIATMIARMLTFTLAMRLLFNSGHVSLSKLSLTGMSESLREICRVGVPAALTNALTPFSAGLITALIALHGSHVIAGYGLAVRFEGLFLLVPMVMGGALSPFVGQNWGAHLEHRVIEALSFARRVSVVWGLSVWVAVILGAPALARALSADAMVQDALTTYLRVISASYALQGVVYAANATFNAVNYPLRATLISTLNSLIIALPLAYLGHIWHGYLGIVVGLLSARLITGLVAHQWVWRLFDEDDKRVALSDAAVKSKLYQLESALPDLALDLERLVLRLGHLSELSVSGARQDALTYMLGSREIAHLRADGTFDICLPPQLRDAVVNAGWGEHHRREYDGCWVSHHLTRADDLEEFARLICLAHAYVTCLKDPAPLEVAQSEAARYCEVTRTLEARAELKDLTLPNHIISALIKAVQSARQRLHEEPAHA